MTTVNRTSVVLSMIACFVALLLAVPTGAGTARADSVGQRIDGCDDTTPWIDSISVEPYHNGGFKIAITPTSESRNAGSAPLRVDVTNDMWHTVQGCVTGLYGSLADSIWQQLDCHRVFGVVSAATGPTYDLESTHAPLVQTSTVAYVNTHCLNEDGVNGGSAVRVYDPPVPGLATF